MNGVNLSPILFRYMIVHHARMVVVTLFGILAVFGVLDMAELYRRASEKEGVSVLTVFLMEAIKLPSMLPELIPFAVLIGSIISYHRLRMTNEIVIARTSGLSQIRLVIPGSVFAFVLAAFMLVVVDPIASATSARYDAIESEVFGSGPRNLTVSTEGVWFLDQGGEVSRIINGESIGLVDSSITNPVVYSFDGDDQIIARYYPDEMTLREGYWELKGGVYMNQSGQVFPMEDRQILTELSQRDLSHSNKPPDTVPVFEIWNYIKVLQKAGLPVLGHSSYLYTQLSLPLVLIGMVMIVAWLTLGFGVRGGWIHLVVLSMVSGLVFYFIKDFLYVMGTSGRLPPFVAGFAPGTIMVCLGTTLLMRADEKGQ